MVLGKDYVRSSLKSDSRNRFMEVDRGKFSQEEAEQFLCYMLGDECELSMVVVRDVLCEYPYYSSYPFLNFMREVFRFNCV